MRRHRPLGDEQPGGDLLVAEALGNQLGDLDFPPAEGSGFAAMRVAAHRLTLHVAPAEGA